MTGQGWPGLGFDPAPGSPAAAAGLADQLRKTSDYLRETYEVLSKVATDSKSWTGEASKAFAGRLGELPKHLDNAHQSLMKASTVLRGWESTLSDLQKRARVLEERAVEARKQVTAAEQAEAQARANPDLNLAGRYFPTEAELRSAQRRYEAARAALDQAAQRAENARASLQALLKEAERLQDQHSSEASRTADNVRGATDGLAPPEPGWLDQFEGWLKKHLGDIGDIAGLLSAICGVLAFIPVLTPVMGPLAIIFGAVALGAHGLDMVANGKWNDPNTWVTLAGDALGLVPGLGAIGKGLAQSADAFRIVDGLGGVAQAGLSVFAREAAAGAAQAAPMFEKLAAPLARFGANTEIIAKATQGVVNLGAQVPTVIEWLTPGETQATEKSVAGAISAGGNFGQTFGSWRKAGEGVMDLWGSLGRLARATA